LLFCPGSFAKNVLQVSSYTVQYLVHWNAQRILHVTPLQTSSSDAAINAQSIFVSRYPPLPIARYSRRKLSELEQGQVNKLVQDST